MKNIKDILDSQKVEPTPECWDKLSGRLDVLMPQGQGGAPASPAPGASHAFWTVGTKLVTTLVGTAVVGAAVTFAVLKNQPAEPVEQTVEKTIPTTEVAHNFNDVVPAESPIAENSLPVSSTHHTNESIHPTATSSAAVSPANNTTTAADVVGSSPITQTTAADVKPVALPVSPKVSIPSVQHNPTIGKVALPSTFSKNAQDDPALQNLPEDAIDWNQPVKVEIPNVFTPNGDGINDRFVILGIDNCTKRQLIVRNRSGNIVYRSNYYDNSWTGDDCVDGTYSYQFIFSNNNIEQTLSGFVSIIRK